MLSASPSVTEDGITWPSRVSLSGFILENAFPHTLFLIFFTYTHLKVMWNVYPMVAALPSTRILTRNATRPCLQRVPIMEEER